MIQFFVITKPLDTFYFQFTFLLNVFSIFKKSNSILKHSVVKISTRVKFQLIYRLNFLALRFDDIPLQFSCLER